MVNGYSGGDGNIFDQVHAQINALYGDEFYFLLQ